MEFLVQIVIDTRRVSAGKRDKLYEEEGKRVVELTKMGYCQRLWRIPGQTANWGLWTAVDATDLHGALESLPLWRYQTVTVHPLALNVNDPLRGDEQTKPFDTPAMAGALAGYR